MQTDCENCNQFFLYLSRIQLFYIIDVTEWCFFEWYWCVLVWGKCLLYLSLSHTHTIYIALCVLPICVLRARSLLMLFFALYLFQLNHQNSRNLFMETPFILIFTTTNITNLRNKICVCFRLYKPFLDKKKWVHIRFHIDDDDDDDDGSHTKYINYFTWNLFTTEILCF